MFFRACTLTVALVFTSLLGQANAQTSVPTYRVTYCVQVKYEMWRNGATYWATEYETSNLSEPQFVYQLFGAAHDNGTLCAILGCGFDWIVRDIRIKTKYDWFLPPVTRLAPTNLEIRKY